MESPAVHAADDAGRDEPARARDRAARPQHHPGVVQELCLAQKPGRIRGADPARVEVLGVAVARADEVARIKGLVHGGNVVRRDDVVGVHDEEGLVLVTVLVEDAVEGVVKHPALALAGEVVALPGDGPRPLCLLCRRVGAGVRHDEAVDEAVVALREDGPHEVGYDGLLVVGGDHEGIAMVLLGLGQLDVTVYDDADDVGKLVEVCEGEEEPQHTVEDDDRRQAGLEHVHEQHLPSSASRPDTLKEPGTDLPARLGASHRSFV